MEVREQDGKIFVWHVRGRILYWAHGADEAAAREALRGSTIHTITSPDRQRMIACDNDDDSLFMPIDLVHACCDHLKIPHPETW